MIWTKPEALEEVNRTWYPPAGAAPQVVVPSWPSLQSPEYQQKIENPNLIQHPALSIETLLNQEAYAHHNYQNPDVSRAFFEVPY